MTFFK